jgi:gliding motility-associated-like protein
VSDSAAFPIRVIAEPAAPVVHDTGYCQFDKNVAQIWATGDSLRWYTSLTAAPGTGSMTAPVPTVTNPAITTYYVTQQQNGCESKKAPLVVTIYVLPDFEISSGRDWVCQFDSLLLEYDGPAYVDPGYTWKLPIGSDFVNGTKYNDEDVMVRFDTVWGRHDVILTVSNYQGRCFTSDTMPIKVVPAPNAHAYIKPDVCLGDTITLALTQHSHNSDKYTWLLDGSPMFTSGKINVISSNINTGGPYVISWNDSGNHIINVTGITVEGCIAEPTADTVKVHTLPDSRYSITQLPNKLCVEDSVLFTAAVKDYSYGYKWEPEHSFVNQNKPEAWGKVELARSVIKLTVTDPFGCYSSYSKQINPDECCKVTMPNAFTPNGDGKNDRFRPIFDGYKRFHIFRVTNRWGQTVFESANSNPSWDGTWNGNMQDMGTYFYYIRYDCGGKSLEASGDVILVR